MIAALASTVQYRQDYVCFKLSTVQTFLFANFASHQGRLSGTDRPADLAGTF
jgi:hypothetical protein